MNRLSLAFFLLVACTLMAQPQDTSRVIFEQRWPAGNPQWFELVVRPDGTAQYRSLPHQQSAPGDPAPEPYEFAFTVSPQSCQLIFAVASRLPVFQDSLDKIKVAFTGTKTLRYEDAAEATSVISYNHSSSPELTRLTELMHGISETIELSQSLQSQLRFDKLALDSTLRKTEELASFHRLSEPQLLEPILTRIANDPAVMNIARQRARAILQTSALIKQK